MKTTVDRVEGRVPVTVLRLDGDLDASNFEAVIDEGGASTRRAPGTSWSTCGDVPFMGSSGLVALHSLALIFNGMEPPDPESGWAAHHALETGRRGRPPAASSRCSCRAAPDSAPRARHAAHGR